MAPPSSNQQRAALRLVTNGAESQLTALWPQLYVPDVGKTIDNLNDVLPLLGSEFGDAASTLAADYYDETRLRKGARGSFDPELADDVDVERWRALSSWATKPLYGAAPDLAAALALLRGGLQRTVANQYRDTIRTNSVRDKASRGWKRVGVGRCDFCQMLLSRGAVYTEATADFDAHDHCGCSAEPVFN